MDLITPEEMALWTQTDLADLNADPYAAEVAAKISDYTRFLGGHPGWGDSEAVPIDVKMLVIRVVRRTYVNPDSEVSSNTGPIGSRILDEAALAAAFSDSELGLLQDYAGAVDGGLGGLWTLSTGGASTQLSPTIYVGDDSQVNLGDEREWMIPFADINDVGIQDEDFA